MIYRYNQTIKEQQSNIVLIMLVVALCLTILIKAQVSLDDLLFTINVIKAGF